VIIAPHPFDNPEFNASLAQTDNPLALMRTTLKTAQQQLKDAFLHGTPVA
jgi:hypothetical protein